MVHTATLAAVLTAATPLLPWVQSGQAVRNGFALADTARILGVADGALRLLLVGAYALPALAAGAFLATVAQRPAVVAALALTIAAIAVAGAVVTLSTDLNTRIGPYAAFVLGTVTGLAAARLVAAKEAHR